MSTPDLSIGAVEVAILISSVLYGVTTLQAWTYAERFPNDKRHLRIAAALMWLFETLHTLFNWIFLYWVTVTNYGKIASVDTPHWSLVSSVPFTFLIAFMVQIFFANRVRIFSERLTITVIAVTGAVLHFAAGMALAALLSRSVTTSDFFKVWRWLSTLQFVLSAAIDVLNTSSLCFFLSRKRSSMTHTQRIVDKLVVYTIETGLITTICAVFIVIAYFAWPTTFVNFALFIIYPKLFANSFFAGLNARKYLRSEMGITASNTSRPRVYVRPPPQPQNGAIALPLATHDPSKLYETPSPPYVPSSSFEYEESGRKMRG